MKAVRFFSLIAGLGVLVMGLLGFVESFIPLPSDAPALRIDSFYGYLFGLFPTNIVHNIVRIVIGLLGVLSYRSYSESRAYARLFGLAYLLLAIMGLIPGLNTMFGIMPIFGNDILFSSVSALLGIYFGFASLPQNIQANNNGRISVGHR